MRLIERYTQIDTADLRLWLVLGSLRLVWRRHALICLAPPKGSV